MKKFLSIFAIAGSLTMAACSSNPNALQSEKGITYSDTAGLAQFQAWKAQQAMEDMNTAATASATTKTATTRKTSTAKRSTPTTNKTIGSTNSYPAKPAEKKGWSKAAKGTAIGAGSGAILGAVINKRNRAVGAVIGGVAGGAVGYGIGRHMDKKDGRY